VCSKPVAVIVPAQLLKKAEQTWLKMTLDPDGLSGVPARPHAMAE
jgi:hypothetical protein